MNKPATYIYVKINSFEPIDEDGFEETYERRNFIELMNNYTERFLSEIKCIHSTKSFLRVIHHFGFMYFQY